MNLKQLKKKEIFEKIKNILIKEFNMSKVRITEDSNFQDVLGMDSLDFINFIMNIETTFDIEIKNEKMENFKTVKDLIEYIYEQKNNKIF